MRAVRQVRTEADEAQRQRRTIPQGWVLQQRGRDNSALDWIPCRHRSTGPSPERATPEIGSGCSCQVTRKSEARDFGAGLPKAVFHAIHHQGRGRP